MLFITTNENLKRQGLKGIICLLAILKANFLHEMEMYIPRKALIRIYIDKVIKKIRPLNPLAQIAAVY